MPVLEGKISSAGLYKTSDDKTLEFELQNQSNEDLYVLKWYTPLEGMWSDCLKVMRNGERVPYDGPLVKRGNPSAEDYILIRAGETTTRRFDLHRAYDISVPGEYDVSLDTNVLDLHPADSPVSLLAKLSNALESDEQVPLEGGGTIFVVEPGDEPLMTEGQMARQIDAEKQSSKKAVPKAGLQDPEIKGGNGDQQAKMMQAHQDGYSLAVSALNNMANDSNYKEWFGAHTTARFQLAQDHFIKIRDGMESKTFTYDLSGTGCQSSWYAYTHKGTTTIWMCGEFWKAPATGTDSKAGTVVHEHSHASALTDDLSYNQSNCRKLAINEPDKAVRNADTHEYYSGG